MEEEEEELQRWSHVWWAFASSLRGSHADQADLELERIRISAGYTLFVFGIHTGYTLYNPGIHM